jgi:predicted homoserine dehydrogenase-like protein
MDSWGKNLLHTSPIGVVGSGFIARQLVRHLLALGCKPPCVLTRRQPQEVSGFDSLVRVTTSLDAFLSTSKIVVECSGDPLHATRVVAAAFDAGRPVVTMNSEFHVTCGSYFVGKGYLTEAEGDQPGSLAALAEDVRMAGFSPLVYGNMKGFMDLRPTPDSMADWSKRQQFSLDMVNSFTDGTKLQIEQALVANGLGAGIARTGMIGPSGEEPLKGAQALAKAATELGRPLADYLVAQNLRPGVFIVATHFSETVALRNLKLGDGPFYYLERPYHLCGLEIPKTIIRVLSGQPPLLNNSSLPTINVAAVSKRDLPRGTHIQKGIGSFDVRGVAVNTAEVPEAVPIGLLNAAVVRNDVDKDSILRWQDVELPDHEAVAICQKLFQRSGPKKGRDNQTPSDLTANRLARP